MPRRRLTQDKKLRKKFTGTPEKVVNLFTFIPREVREILANLGFKSLNEVIGRTDLLKQVSKGSPKILRFRFKSFICLS
ncbi:MAG: hypothetical protein CM1200mP13_04560 [Candidatus Pelagibacterales bacterium]|nr:MAG: hypothetical protein CM1200mP13_04560 [Pelagibacterales bacterium]